ncbi:transcription factor bHLH93-like [Humulus lupulus]|uniref:transcription factor bHLH93-like n=1 Tax=Humulus lupulus TaxID=3486 RepID=UPI002B40DDA8|nr:transcription factor bHLH93-like [Humulus lupulus]
MELTQHGFFEELLAPRRDNWSSFSSGLSDQFYPSGWSFDSFEENPVLAISNPPFAGFSNPTEPNSECPFVEQTLYPFVDHGSVVLMPELDSPYTKNNNDTPSFPSQEDYPSMVEDEEFGFLGCENQSCLEENKNISGCCKVEMEQQTTELPAFNIGLCSGEKKTTTSRPKKLEGQPSKNLMAERRRRKRLNDRLSMLRSIVPKISKMDRTSILGDTIDYMKELLERISKLQEEGMEDGNNQINLLGISKELKPSEVLVRNSPKFDVERRDIDTRIDICCAAKPGLLLSTVNTLEALGLEIQQCVISCFNDFSMQASCSEGAQERTLISSEDIKQAIFRNAGYGGRCL